MEIQVIAIDKNHQRHIAEVLTRAEFDAEGGAGCATIARTYCQDNGIAFRDWKAEPVAANASGRQAVA